MCVRACVRWFVRWMVRPGRQGRMRGGNRVVFKEKWEAVKMR